MRLVVYGPHKRLGLVQDEQVIDLNLAYAKYLREAREGTWTLSRSGSNGT